jgi:hypothetical protein
MTPEQLEEERRLAHEKAIAINNGKAAQVQSSSKLNFVLIAWILVAIPIAYGISSTLQKAWILFH